MVDMQVHTNYSYDGYVTLEGLDRGCSRRGITTVAITDHNEIAGAFEAAKRYRDGRMSTRVIVGEEINTCQGEVIGLFLRAHVPRDMSMPETLAAIHDQGGLVYLNHPFGYGQRSSRLRMEDLEGLWDRIDIVEVFNGRNMDQQANRRAAELAKAHGKPGGVGTDAHSAWEVGRSFVRMPSFNGPEEFLHALHRACYTCRPCPLAYRVLFKLRKLTWARPLPKVPSA